MGEIRDRNSDPPERRCRFCDKKLSERARKCLHCEEYQSRLDLVLSGLDLKGFVALLPVATLAYVFLTERLTTDSTKLRLELVECKKDSALVLSTNTGNKAAIVKEALFAVLPDNAKPFKSLAPEVRVVPGGEYRFLDLQVDTTTDFSGLVTSGQAERKDCKVTITVTYSGFEAANMKEDLQCACS
ncbi:MAG: hypothetical protein ACR2RE_08505 [Geminicoccaceae bacterium]